MATTGDVWIIPSFRIWDYVLHVEHISCVITNCGQHQWVIPSPLSIAFKALWEENTTRKLLSISLDLFFKILLFQVAFLIFFYISIFSPYFLLVGLLLQSVTLFYGPRCPLSPERPLNLITHSQWACDHLRQNIVLCHYNMVNFHPNPHKRHPITCPWGRDMGCLLWM